MYLKLEKSQPDLQTGLSGASTIQRSNWQLQTTHVKDLIREAPFQIVGSESQRRFLEISKTRHCC